MTFIKVMSRKVQKWLDRFLNPEPGSQYEPLANQHGIVYWLESIAYEEGQPTYLRLVYRRKGVGNPNVVNLAWDLPDRLLLGDIYLPPKHRRAGLGSQLLRRVITLAKQQGVRSIQGNIVQKDIDSNPKLLDWYQRHGFRVEPPTEKRYVHSIALDLV